MKLVEVTPEWFGENSLDLFVRRQHVTEVYRLDEDGMFQKVDCSYWEDWDEENKKKIARQMLSPECQAFCIRNGDDGGVNAMVVMENNLRGKRMIMDLLCVEKDTRRQGMGSMLLGIAKALAKKAGAEEIYVSASSDADTVEFFKALGAKVAKKVEHDIAQKNPHDIPMVFPC